MMRFRKRNALKTRVGSGGGLATDPLGLGDFTDGGRGGTMPPAEYVQCRDERSRGKGPRI